MSLGPLMIDVRGQELDATDRELLRHPSVGGLLLFSRNYSSPEQVERLTAEVHELRDPPLIVAVDHEGGRVQRFRKAFSGLPPARFLGHQYDLDPDTGTELARVCGWLLAAELRAVGVDLSFAPVVDLDYAVSEIIGDRALHRNPDVVSSLAVAIMSGMREAGMVSVAKHFPGHGAVVADSHVAVPVDRRELVDLDAELAPYRRLIANGISGVMAAHVVFPAVDSLPASLSSRWIAGILRGELGFHGVVFADDLSMAGAAIAGDMLERARLALAAGCDVLPVCNDRPAAVRLIDELGDVADPARQARLMRLHGRAAPDRKTLLASARWQDVNQRLRSSFEPPELSLEAGRA
jgi:beta-N-acetylhexosaminidase